MRKLSVERRRKLILSVGTHRGERHLSPLEVASALDEEIAAGTSMQELAADLHLENATMLSRFRRLLSLSPFVQHLVDWGTSDLTISFSLASHIARLRSVADQEYVARAALEYKLSSNEVQQLIQVVNRAQLSVEEGVRSVLRMRPQVESLHLLIGAVVSADLQQALAGLTQAERDHLLTHALSRNWSSDESPRVRLGVDRFTLIGRAEFAREMQALPGGFEKSINDWLRLEVLP